MKFLDFFKPAWSLVSGLLGGSAMWLTFCVLAFCVGGWAGVEVASMSCKADQLKQLRGEYQAFVQDVKEGALEAKALRAELVVAETTNAELKRRLAHVPTLTRQAQPPGCPVCDLRVTAGAAGLWNGALTGDVPAGACGADGATGEACLAATQLTADDLAANQAENAASCRQDRIRLQRLIDHLKRRER